MGKTLKATCKMCRREGVSLCGKDKCAVKRRPFPPGQHGAKVNRRRMSGYGIQLREKQKAKRLYNVMEKQFRNYFKKANNKQGETGTVLIQLLEMRLDNAVFRLGFGKTRRQARQMVSHGFIEVNGKRVNIASYQVSVGDIITIRDSKKEKGLLNEINERLKLHDTPGWMTVNPEELSGKVTGLPEGLDLASVFDPKLIVEFYSRT